MTHAFRRHLLLHMASLLVLLLDAIGVGLAAFALSRHDPILTMGAALAWGLAVATVQFEVSRCAFAQMLPGYWEIPRRILLQLGGLCAVLTLVVASSNPQLRGAFGRVFAIGLVAGAIPVAIGAVRLMLGSWSIWLVWAMLVGPLDGAATASSQSALDALSAPGLAVVAATNLAVALWFLTPARLARRFAASPESSSVDQAAARETFARQADAFVARRATRHEAVGTFLLRACARRRSTGVLAVLVDHTAASIGRYPASLIAAGFVASVLLIVSFMPLLHASGLFLSVAMLPMAFVRSERRKVVLPVDRGALFRGRLAAVVFCTLASVVMLAAVDAAAGLAAATAARLAVPWTPRETMVQHYPAVIVVGSLMGAVLPTIREGFVMSILVFFMIGVGFAVDARMADHGAIVRAVTCGLALAASAAYLRAHFDAADL